MRAYLFSCFFGVLVIPLAFNLIEIVGGGVQDPDFLYLACALLPMVGAGLYVFHERHRVNSDELPFYARHLMRKDKSFLRQYFTLSGMLVRDHYGDNFKTIATASDNELAAAIVAFNAHAPSDVFAVADARKRQINCEVYRALKYVHTMIAVTGVTGEGLAMVQKAYLNGLRSDADISTMYAFANKVHRQRGQYLCEYVVTTLMRTLLHGAPNPANYDYHQLLDQEPMRSICALLLGVHPHDVSHRYHSRYFFMLQQEQFIIKKRVSFGHSFDAYGFHFYKEGEHPNYDEMEAAAAAAAASAAGMDDGPNRDAQNNYGFGFDFWSRQGNYAGADADADADAGADVNSDPDYFSDFGSTAGSGGSYYSYRDHYRDAYEDAFRSYQDREFERDYNRAYSYASSTGAGTSAGAGAGGAHAGTSGSGAQGGYEGHEGQEGASGSDRLLTKLQQAYRTLELEEDAVFTVVKKQYRKLVFKYHPDHIPGYESLSASEKEHLNQRLYEVVQAYNYILSMSADFDSESEEMAARAHSSRPAAAAS